MVKKQWRRRKEGTATETHWLSPIFMLKPGYEHLSLIQVALLPFFLLYGPSGLGSPKLLTAEKFLNSMVPSSHLSDYENLSSFVHLSVGCRELKATPVCNWFRPVVCLKHPVEGNGKRLHGGIFVVVFIGRGFKLRETNIYPNSKPPTY